MKGTLRREPDAVAALWTRVECVAPFLRSLARRVTLGVSPIDLQDVTQETYLAIWRKLSEYRGEARLETWACGFARIELIRRRDRNARRRESAEESMPEPLSHDPPPSDALEHLQREVDRLGPTCASVIRLKCLEDLTFREIGGRLGMSPNTAKSLHYRGLTGLRERLAGLADELLD